MLSYRLNILGGVLMAATSVVHAQAPEFPGAAESAAATRGLAPAQLAAIRVIGRNVLAAKKSAIEDTADAAQLSQLRSIVDKLIATDLDSMHSAPIMIQGGAIPEVSPARAAATERREAARTVAHALAGQLRQRGERLASLAQAGGAQSGGAPETLSAGLPIGNQRAQLFQRLTQKLDAALAANNLERIAQLHTLRDQLQAGSGQLVGAPLTRRSTPTMQAMLPTGETRIRAVSSTEAKLRAVPPVPGKPGVAIKPSTSGAQAK